MYFVATGLSTSDAKQRKSIQLAVDHRQLCDLLGTSDNERNEYKKRSVSAEVRQDIQVSYSPTGSRVTQIRNGLQAARRSRLGRSRNFRCLW